MNKVEIIADSKSEFGPRLTSIVATFPRMLLAEVNTHRVFTRNSASSRAIRFQQMVKNCQENPFIPFRFQKDHPGMQGTEYFEGKEHTTCINKWLHARDGAIKSATSLHEFGVTKQLANHILEPFQYHTALITASEWENFINLRVSTFAEDHFQDLAEKMLNALNESEPVYLKAGEWHRPFSNNFDTEALFEYIKKHPELLEEYEDLDSFINRDIIILGDLITKISTVRCARISYNTQDKEISIEADLKLHDRLRDSGHWSAFEHCARAMNNQEYHDEWGRGDGEGGYEPGWCGNFQGFIQYRKEFAYENRTDSRLLKK